MIDLSTLLRRPPKAIIFDMDGVLWNSSRAHEAAYRVVLEPQGVPVPPYAELAGRRTDAVMRELLEASGTASTRERIEALCAAKRSHAARLLRDDPPLAPNCRRVLDTLARHRPLALASGASEAGVELFFEISGTRPLFEVVLSGASVQHAKPHPEIFERALQRLGIDALDALVVEDSPHGIAAARAAGIAVFALTGTCDAETLRQAGAAAVIERLEQLESLDADGR